MKKWIKVQERLPAAGETPRCKVRHANGKIRKEVQLKKVQEDDCDWRFLDDNAELSYDWSVTHWQETS